MTPDERHILGQWFTPAAVADLTLRLALPGATGDGARICDPACGDGVFLARARALGVAAERLCGMDIDRRAADLARHAVPGAAIHCRDLFAADPARFDAVVGNPPYVRQERLSRTQKQEARAALARDWPEAPARDLEKLTGRGDLAAACILRAVALARPGARIALVVSSALLDAGYAAPLWRTVALGARVLALIDAPGERWFADAAVHAMILVMERVERADTTAPPVRVARLTVPTAVAAQTVRDLDDLDRVATVRPAPASAPDTWAAHLRAPTVWFDFVGRAGDALVPLGEVARVQRGMTTGANDVFYLPRDRARALGIEDEVLMPLVRSPRDAGRIALEPEKTSHVVLAAPADPDELARYPAAQAYLHAHRACAGRPTMAGRDPWWALPLRPAQLFLTKAYAARFVQRLARTPMAADQRVYAVFPKQGVDVRVLAAILNTTWTAFALESLGRASMGEGALEWTVAGAAALPVLDPRRLGQPNSKAAARLVAALDGMAGRPIEVIGRERTFADRRDLDLAAARIFAPAAEAGEVLLDAVWPALIRAVEHRNARPDRAPV